MILSGGFIYLNYNWKHYMFMLLKNIRKKSNKFRDPLQRETTQNTDYGEAHKF